MNRKKIGLYLFIAALVFLYQACESASKLGISNGKTIMFFVITSLFSLIGLFCVLTAKPAPNEKMVQMKRRGILLPVIVGGVVLLFFPGIDYYKGIMLGKAESVLRTKYTSVNVRSIEWSEAEIPRDIDSPYARFGGDKKERAWKINADIKDAHGKAVRCEGYLSITGELVIVWPLEVMKALKSGAKAP